MGNCTNKHTKQLYWMAALGSAKCFLLLSVELIRCEEFQTRNTDKMPRHTQTYLHTCTHEAQTTSGGLLITAQSVSLTERRIVCLCNASTETNWCLEGVLQQVDRWVMHKAQTILSKTLNWSFFKLENMRDGINQSSNASFSPTKGTSQYSILLTNSCFAVFFPRVVCVISSELVICSLRFQV